jgi:rubrerythrin
MPLEYTAGEILKVAEHLERNAARFYRAAAPRHPQAANTLLALAQMEEKHEAVFKLMAQGLHAQVMRCHERPTFGERHAYLEMLAEASGCEGTERPDALCGDETLEEILRQAIEKEKHTILFNAGLRCSVAEEATARVDEILTEEMDHMVMLSRMLQSFMEKPRGGAGGLASIT